MPKYKQIFFDFDGTLCDTYPGKKMAFIKTVNNNKKGGVTSTLLHLSISSSLKKAFSKQMGICDKWRLNELKKQFEQHYGQEIYLSAELYPGIFDLLTELNQNTDLFIVSAKPKKLVLALLYHFKIFHLFKTIRCVENLKGLRTKTEIIAQLKTTHQAIMIGDQPIDITSGKKNSIATAAIQYGYGRKSELLNAQPDYLIHSVAALRVLLS